MKKKEQYKRIINVTLKNRYNSEVLRGDIINEDTIDGKTFYVLQINNRIFKCAKESYSIQKRG